MPQNTTVPIKKALLIGVNDYAPTGRDNGDLRGCLNDVRDVRDLLRERGFSRQNIVILTNNMADLKKTGWAMSDFFGKSEAGDELFFYFSGHGSQIPDFSGEEKDRMDEVICLHDLVRGGYMRDDEIRAYFNLAHPESTLTAMFDCCYAGTISRVEAAPMASVTGRYLPFPPNAPVRRKGIGETEADQTDQPRLVIEACAEHQVSAEMLLPVGLRRQTRGVFTYFFCKYLRQHPKASAEEAVAYCGEMLTNFRLRQTPRVEAVNMNPKNPIFAK